MALGFQSSEAQHGFALVAVTALFFGAAPTLARLAFDGGTDPLTLQTVRFWIGGAGLWMLVAGRRIRGAPVPHQTPAILALAALTGAASYGYMTSVRHIPVPLATLTFFVFPLVVALLSHLAGDERLTPRRTIALVIGFAGLAMVLGGGFEIVDPIGIGLAFGAGLCVAFSFLLSRRLTAEIPPILLTALITTISAMVYGALAVAHGPLVFPIGTVGWIGLLGNAICYVVGLSCLYAAIRRLGSVRVAVVVNLEPVVSVGFAAAILGELLTPLQAVGAVVVLGGIAVMQSERMR